MSFTVTVKLTLPVLPSSPSFSGNVTSIPFVVKSSNLFPISSLFTLMLPSTNVVPSGILSFTSTVAGAVPSFVKFIVYVISSPAFTVLPLAGIDVLLYATSDLFTVSVTSSVSSLSTTAVFLICFINSPSSNGFTVTWKLTVDVPAPNSVLAGTFTPIPSLKFSSVFSVSMLFTLMLPPTNVVPSGISSLISISLSKSPVLLAVIVYVIVSPSTTYSKPFAVSAVLLPSIIGSIYVCSTVLVASPSTYAIFLILSPLFKSFTVTLNSTVLVSPDGTFTSIPFIVRSSIPYTLLSPCTFTLPSSYVVPSGISSLTVTSPGAVPSFVNVIVYVISCPFTTVLPFAGIDVFSPVICAFFISSVTSFVSVPSTFALFVIVPSFTPSKLFTLTSNVTVVSPCFATFTGIPFVNSVCVYSVSPSFTLMLPSIKPVPVGIVSFTITSFPKSPVLDIVIIYFTISPSSTYPTSGCSIVISLCDSIIAFT